MGLNAVVYKNKSGLALAYGSEFAKVDPDTGEVFFEDPEVYSHYSEGFFEAARKRLGNIAAVSQVREMILELLGTETTLYDKILYSGTHSGDIISLSEAQQLERELQTLESSIVAKRSPEIQIFIDEVKSLILAAKEQNNPIVFI